MAVNGSHSGRWLAIAPPILFIAFILGADAVEGPKTAFVGLLATAPMLAAVFGTPLQTAFISVTTLASAYAFGRIASDGNLPAQTIRLVAITLFSIIAILAARQRVVRERDLLAAQTEAALADTMRVRARTDELTGILNRRGVEEVLASRGAGMAWSVAIADCDDFKRVNDEYGHLVGDEYLRAIAQRLRAALPDKDVLARWGGDEFLLAVALPQDSAIRVIERVHHQVTDSPIRTSVGAISAQITFGVAEWRDDEELGHVIRRADRAMYSGKREGANQIVLAR